MADKATFQPISEHARHQKYLAAFKCETLAEYLSCIHEYVTDENISVENSDDLELFDSFAYDSKFKIIRFAYSHLYLKKDIDGLVKFLEFLYRSSEIIVYDTLDTLCKDHPLQINDLFKRLPNHLSSMLLKVILDNPKVTENNDKLKLYILFS